MTPTERELTALRGTIAGEVVLPGSADYERARRPAIARFRDVRPRAVVRCATTQDVVETLAVARLLRVPVAVRGGGHCFAGRSSTTGIVLDVSPMATVALRDGLAVVGAGTRLGALYDALDGHGLTLPAGCEPAVGVTGLTLGGGFGELGRRHGLTCDRLAGARVVCADGRVVDCDAHREPDLFWALRGGGPGFGVVTTLLFRPVPAPPTTVFHLTWPAGTATAVVSAWPHWAPGAPDQLTATLRLVAPADPRLPAVVTLVGTMLDGDPAPLLDEFVRRAGVEPARATLASGSFRQAKRSLAELDASGAEPAALLHSRSEFFRRPLPPDAAAALVHSVVADRVPGQAHEVDLIPWGGAYNRVRPDATAFAHRAEAYLLQIGLVTSGDTRRLDRSWSTVAPFGSRRVYPNFPDPDRALPAAAYHGGNHERLRRIRDAADPDAVLSPRLEEPCAAPDP
ncbi:FAD-binding oxidoreductase [Pseudonocardia sp. DSM 110487]|uniref:FAD-binding oxidoreductase n=1 Tax=Pseudonocardia sp. DSM 110487 TaxID=2865833 RepID=UPI001C6947FD|nr:FAD-binding oxidoreductase [Pseudonocardia sp. DSM 110487]QYN39776.1 FAD-binding oxidoreductase [Pseudonocardia sp. DSM 110487]